MGLLRYKGYTGKIDYSEEEKTFFGKVLGLRRDGIIFEGDSVFEIRKDFEDAIDQYLKHCKESGIEPEKPYNGKFVLNNNHYLSRRTMLPPAASTWMTESLWTLPARISFASWFTNSLCIKRLIGLAP